MLVPVSLMMNKLDAETVLVAVAIAVARAGNYRMSSASSFLQFHFTSFIDLARQDS